LKEYGLESRCASLRSINTRPDLAELLEGKEEVVFAKLEEESLKAINEDGADVIVLGSTTMHQSHRYLQEKLPVPVINPGQVAYKLCELFLQLGLKHSKKAFASPEMPNDDMILSRGKK
jgi:allantoin racemase